MQKNEISNRYGKKWFIFYTRVRPWLILFSLPMTLIWFAAIYYDAGILMFVSIIATLILAALQIVIFCTSFGNYPSFVSNIKPILIIESIIIAFQNLPTIFIVLEALDNTELLIALILLLPFALGLFALWFFVNIAYFEKRIRTEAEKVYSATYYQRTGKATAPYTYKRTVYPNFHYCPKCGGRLSEGCAYCPFCGNNLLQYQPVSQHGIKNSSEDTPCQTENKKDLNNLRNVLETALRYETDEGMIAYLRKFDYSEIRGLLSHHPSQVRNSIIVILSSIE